MEKNEELISKAIEEQKVLDFFYRKADNSPSHRTDVVPKEINDTLLFAEEERRFKTFRLDRIYGLRIQYD